MFQFPGFPSIRYGLAYGYQRSALMGFPIRISPDRWIFAPPRSFSQLVTSFLGPQCLGIHPAPFMLDLSSGRLFLIALRTGLFLIHMNCYSLSRHFRGYSDVFLSRIVFRLDISFCMRFSRYVPDKFLIRLALSAIRKRKASFLSSHHR